MRHPKYLHHVFDSRKPSKRVGSEIALLWDLLDLILKRGETPATQSETRSIYVIYTLLLYVLYAEGFGIVLCGAGFSIGYHLYYTFGAVKTGGQAWGMLRFKIPFTNTGIHIHHWVYCMALLFIYFSVISGPPNLFIIGGLMGGIAHGVQFSDWSQHFY